MFLDLIRRLRHGPLKLLSPLWVVMGGLFRKAVAGSGLTVRQRIGPYGPFRLDVKFAFSDFAHWGGAHNDGFRDCVEACRGKSCVLDVGGHIGLVSLPAASVMAEGGRLIAFEPSTANRALLVRHAALNGYSERVTAEGALVGAEDLDAVSFFESESASGMNSVVPGAMGADYRSVSKAQVALDSYCARHDLAPQVVKIDVEGAEVGVLSGACAMLAKHRPLIFLSVHPRQIALSGSSLATLAALIDVLGYDCRHADGSPVMAFELREYVLSPRET